MTAKTSAKLYEQVADVLADEYSLAPTESGRKHIVHIASGLADVFTLDNPRFNRDRFYAAIFQGRNDARFNRQDHRLRGR